MRRAEQTDRDRRALAAVRRMWREEDAGGPVDDPGYEDRAVAWIEANASHRIGWLAEVDGRPVGMLTVIIVERMPQPATFLLRLAVFTALEGAIIWLGTMVRRRADAGNYGRLIGLIIAFLVYEAMSGFVFYLFF